MNNPIDSAQEQEFAKNTFYRDQYRRALGFLIFLSVTALLFAGILFYVSIKRQQPRYYATTANGLLIPLHSLSEPVVTNHYILEWASLAVRTAFNIGFAHANQDLEQAHPYFTEGGWGKLQSAIKKAGLLQDIIDKKLLMSAIVSDTPVIIDAGIREGTYSWTVQLPLLLTFASASETTHEKLIVTMVIRRVPVMDIPKGIQITSFATQSSS